MPSVPVWGILCVIGGFLYHLALGYFYTVGNMNPYVKSFMNISSSQTSWFSSTILALQAVTMPAGGYLANVIGYRWILVFGIVFSSGGILFTRLTIWHGLGPYIATYCICFGIGMGLPYSVIFSIASSWFPKHRATVVGIIASGFGLGALVFTPIQSNIINPRNLAQIDGKFPPEVEERIPLAFLVLGGIVFGLEVIASLLLKKRVEETNLDSSFAEDFNEDESVNVKDAEGVEEIKIEPPKEQRSYTISDSLKSIDFYMLWFIVFMDIVSVVIFTSNYKLYGLQAKFDDQFLSTISTVSSVFNCVGRIFWGFMVDLFSSKCPMLCFLLIWGTAFISFPYIAAGAAGKPLYAIWVFVIFFALSAHFVVIPGTCTRVFGPANMATIYGLIYFATCPSALITAGIFSQPFFSSQWVILFTVCGCVCFIAFIMALFINDKDARCVSFTNKIAAVCNPLRRNLENENSNLSVILYDDENE